MITTDTTTCTQTPGDGCASDPELGTCPRCGYINHDIPMSTDDAHGELCEPSDQERAL